MSSLMLMMFLVAFHGERGGPRRHSRPDLKRAYLSGEKFVGVICYVSSVKIFRLLKASSNSFINI